MADDEDPFKKLKRLKQEEQQAALAAQQEIQQRAQRVNQVVEGIIKPAMVDLQKKLKQVGVEPDLNSGQPIQWRGTAVKVERAERYLFAVKFEGIYRAVKKPGENKVRLGGGFHPEIGIVKLDESTFGLYAPRFPIDEDTSEPFVIRDRFTVDDITPERVEKALTAAVASVLPKD